VLPSPGVLYEPSCPPLRLLTQAEKFINDLVLTPNGQIRILTGEPYFFPLVFSLKGGGVLYEPSCPPSRPLTHGEGCELTSSLLYKVKGRSYWGTTPFSLGVFTRGGGVLCEPTFPDPETSNSSEQLVTDFIFA